MIRTLALISQKGGSGKTTLALALAAAHERAAGQAAVIDLDPQGSATVWGRLRGGVPPAVIAAHPPRLARAWGIDPKAEAPSPDALADAEPGDDRNRIGPAQWMLQPGGSVAWRLTGGGVAVHPKFP